MEDPGTTEEPTKTRVPWTRKSVACTNCRKRKSRCSGQPCQFCQKYGFECIVEPLTHSNAADTSNRPPKRTSDTPHIDSTQRQRRTSSGPQHAASQPTSHLQTFSPMRLDEAPDNGPATNAMGQPLSLSLLPSFSKSSPFYGSSSALSFAKVIIAAALPNFSLASPATPEGIAEASRTAVYTSAAEDATDLPMRSMADSMVETFFHRSHGQSLHISPNPCSWS